MRVDFYHLTRDPAPSALAMLARKVVQSGERLLVVSEDPGQLADISDALWGLEPEGFLANGSADEEGAERQPILLSDAVSPRNGARFVAFADGTWRESEAEFARTFFLFDEETRGPARSVWKALRDAGGRELHYWKQQDGRWVEAG